MDGNNLSLMMQMYALVAEMEGMKADNQERIFLGNSPSYSERDFDYIATQLKELAQHTTSGE